MDLYFAFGRNAEYYEWEFTPSTTPTTDSTATTTASVPGAQGQDQDQEQDEHADADADIDEGYSSPPAHRAAHVQAPTRDRRPAHPARLRRAAAAQGAEPAAQAAAQAHRVGRRRLGPAAACWGRGVCLGRGQARGEVVGKIMEVVGKSEWPSTGSRLWEAFSSPLLSN